MVLDGGLSYLLISFPIRNSSGRVPNVVRSTLSPRVPKPINVSVGKWMILPMTRGYYLTLVERRVINHYKITVVIVASLSVIQVAPPIFCLCYITAAFLGPCPPCPKTVNVKCHCGRSSPKVQRCGSKGWSCGRVCRKVLLCGQHVCESVCHEGIFT